MVRVHRRLTCFRDVSPSVEMCCDRESQAYDSYWLHRREPAAQMHIPLVHDRLELCILCTRNLGNCVRQQCPHKPLHIITIRLTVAQGPWRGRKLNGCQAVRQTRLSRISKGCSINLRLPRINHVCPWVVSQYCVYAGGTHVRIYMDPFTKGKHALG
jgi:hypothetical protein